MKYVSIFLIFSLVISFFVGGRSLEIGKDTLNYYYFYDSILRNNFHYIRISEPVFVNIANFFVYLGLSFNDFLRFISFLSIFVLFLSYLRFYKIDLQVTESKINIFVFLIPLIIILSPFFWSSQINVIRSGLAIPFIYLSIYFLLKGRIYFFLFLGIFSIFCHYSSFLYILMLVFFNNMEKNFYKIFFLIVIGYLSGINEIIFRSLFGALFIDNIYSGYLEEGGAVSENYRIGVRYDFALFTLFFIVMFWLTLRKCNLNAYMPLLKCMCILTIPFFIIGTIPFSDRLLLPFWMLIPFIFSFFLIEIKPNRNYYYLLYISSIFVFVFVFFNKLDYFNLI